MTALDLVLACAPLIDPVTMSALIEQESRGNPLALHDNATAISYQSGSQAQAIALARKLIESGHSVDLGLAQINSRNLSGLGQSVETIFNPCVNLQAAQTVLLAAWKQSAGQLPAALSAYNTGQVNSRAGARYSASVYAKARTPLVPAIPGGRLPAWMARPIAGSASLAGADLSAQRLPSAAPPQAPVRASPRRPKLTPANSPLSPDREGLNPP